MKTMLFRTGVVLSFLFIVGCSSTSDQQQTAESTQATDSHQTTNSSNKELTDPRDPFESVNRSMWDFNWNVLDKKILRPVAVAYVDNTPVVIRDGLLNMAENLDEPSSVLNNLLQGKLSGAASDTGRFLVNSTVGLLGFFDVAKLLGMERAQEEFSETLGVWGVGTGPFMMVPGLGPTEPRSITGDLVDSSYFPLDALNIYTSIATNLVKALEARGALRAQESMLNDSLDSYVLVKDVYFQKVADDVNDGEVVIDETEDEELDDYLDEID